jgi:hypothetical protein
MSDGPSDSPRIYCVTSDGCPGPSDIREPSDFYCFTVVHPDLWRNSDASNMCSRIKFHTYDDLAYKN